MTKPVLQVVIASTRPNRMGGTVAEWFVAEAEKHGGFEVQVTDLKELDLPMMNEPKHPAMQDYQFEYTKKWAKIVENSDAFVFVMPEYNFGYNAALKNAIDYLYKEWAYKPVSFVSYGGVSGGLRAVQMLKQVVTTLKMIPLTEQVTIPFVFEYIKDGKLQPTEIVTQSVDVMLNELAKVEKATASLRG
ncbi:MAG: NAD(P)H-dependent oxidoreductase [Actinomycetaceae bacterium]|nr:NAD(P)H-dependent oxidoreductase [Actinomycetaceae bacterium]